jgi:hypothetical protein
VRTIGAAVNFIGVADHRGGDRTAGIDVHALPLVATVEGGEASPVAVGGARELAARIDAVEHGAGNGVIGADREQIQQAAEMAIAALVMMESPQAPTLPGDAGSVGSLALYCKPRATSRT